MYYYTYTCTVGSWFVDMRILKRAAFVRELLRPFKETSVHNTCQLCAGFLRYILLQMAFVSIENTMCAHDARETLKTGTKALHKQRRKLHFQQCLMIVYVSDERASHMGQGKCNRTH